MRRIISLLMVTALLTVSSLPALTQVPVCHAAESNAKYDICHADGAIECHAGYEEHAHLIHGKTGMQMHHSNGEQQPKQHEKNGHDHGDVNHHKKSDDRQTDPQPDSLHKHKTALSAAEKICRIECGCGCNRSVDGFPQALSPHLIPATDSETAEQIVRIDAELFPIQHALAAATPSPPPRRS
ncbi:MAG: hypothetical protein RQ867_07410 [Mariprofundaceae bacterium]|nr:hypothetical protein [Mariprofundaceae bacterium]